MIKNQSCLHEFDDPILMRDVLGELIEYQKHSESFFENKKHWLGWCKVCDNWKIFKFPIVEGDPWRNLRESFVCECGLNGRVRGAFALLDSYIRDEPETINVLLFEQTTKLFEVLKNKYPFIKGSEYLGPSYTPGEIVRSGFGKIKHEDMQNISFESNTLDLIYHGDVLEHVPDHRKALKECARVLKIGGSMVFTAPFFNIEKHLVRAELINDDTVHHLPPAFHGNPLLAEGSLVYTEFGWPLFDDIKNAGFSHVKIILLYDVLQGIVSDNNPYNENHMWPIYFVAQR